jgi:predicted lipoprotein with Yx(FWY)xxD motif
MDARFDMSTFGMGKFGSAAVAGVMLVAGCSSSTGSTTSTTGAGAGGLPVRATPIGRVLVNSAGHTVYELDGATATHQTCTGSCESIWPPVNANGSQVIVNGHPAFTFTGDSSAGQTTGQGLHDQWGTWHALDAGGNPIMASNATPTSSSSSMNGGGSY